MIEVVWTILRRGNRFLLAQRAEKDIAGGSWVFPGGKIDQEDTGPILAARRELLEEVGLDGKKFRKLCSMPLDQYNVQVFYCDQWSGVQHPACEDIVGVGWFTLAEMYALGQSLAPFVNQSLSYIAYLIQHYDNHPDQWYELWRICDGND